MSSLEAPSELAVLAALLTLRGRPARLSDALERALPVFPTPEVAANALAAALVESAGERPPREGSRAPAARFLHRVRRRARAGATVALIQRPAPPTGAWRLHAALPPAAVDTLTSAETDRAETATAARVAAARALRLEVRRLASTRHRLAADALAASKALALALAERLIGASLPNAPALLAAWTAAETAGWSADEPIGVRVAPDVVDAVSRALEALGDRFIVSADAGLGPGDVVLDTAHGRRDGRVVTRLGALLAGHRAP